ncbi:DUF7260 family protein [Haloplanus pelagicus]|jgi:hypothetical protein|uniref:DUF7260 family protein n=1 Tax=Haloplanus pelagicus TaxID=2949995 RepID=UPI00203B4911|nr:hypothetical protein [Haloplanus sp. HW8-1]
MTGDIDSFHSTTAAERVRAEVAVVEDELDAFERFKDRITRLQCVPGAGSEFALAEGGPAAQSTAPSVRKLERAYRSTIMSVPHYESEYGDGFEESVRAEFDESVAQVLTGAVPYTPLAKSRLVSACENARHNRFELVDDLERELEALSTAVTRFDEWLTEIEGIRERITRWERCRASEELERIERLRDECDSLSAERQRRIRRQPAALGKQSEPDAFLQYLYRDLSCSKPVLTDVSLIARRIDTEHRRLQKRLMW